MVSILAADVLLSHRKPMYQQVQYWPNIPRLFTINMVKVDTIWWQNHGVNSSQYFMSNYFAYINLFACYTIIRLICRELLQGGTLYPMYINPTLTCAWFVLYMLPIYHYVFLFVSIYGTVKDCMDIFSQGHWFFFSIIVPWRHGR